MIRRDLVKIVLLGGVILATAACGSCGKIGPQKKADDPAPAGNKELYQVDLTKPEGPMYQILRAAQDHDINLFRQSFAPSVEIANINEAGFRKFRNKVLRNKMTPVPESIQQVSDTEAIVKMRNGKGKEIPVHVQKIGDKWLISSFDVSPKLQQRFEEKERKLKEGGGQPQGN